MEEALRIAQAVREACLVTTLQAYEDAGLSGLCHEGRWECAVDAIRTLDLQALVHKIRHQAYKVTDDDVARLRTKYSEDELFEIIVSAAVGASLNGLTIALRAVEQAK